MRFSWSCKGTDFCDSEAAKGLPSFTMHRLRPSDRANSLLFVASLIFFQQCIYFRQYPVLAGESLFTTSTWVILLANNNCYFCYLFLSTTSLDRTCTLVCKVFGVEKERRNCSKVVLNQSMGTGICTARICTQSHTLQCTFTESQFSSSSFQLFLNQFLKDHRH